MTVQSCKIHFCSNLWAGKANTPLLHKIRRNFYNTNTAGLTRKRAWLKILLLFWWLEIPTLTSQQLPEEAIRLIKNQIQLVMQSALLLPPSGKMDKHNLRNFVRKSEFAPHGIDIFSLTCRTAQQSQRTKQQQQQETQQLRSRHLHQHEILVTESEEATKSSKLWINPPDDSVNSCGIEYHQTERHSSATRLLNDGIPGRVGSRGKPT